MLPEKPEPGSPADWLRRARSDLALACALLPPDVLYNELCFHAEQAAEKSIKAVLVERGIEFRKVHSIAYLLRLLPPDIPLPPEAAEAVSLTIYAVIARYPGDYEEITEEIYREAVRIARVVFTWAEQVIGPK
jgi:HEPN domain-containing protein